jgi:hypothetical protein
VPLHLDVSAETILAADGRAEVIEAWRAFIKPNDLQLGWGRFCRDLLEHESVAPAEFLNLRSVLGQLLDGASGSVEALAQSLGAELPEGRGRAMRRLTALAFVTRAVLAGRVAPVRTRSHR